MNNFWLFSLGTSFSLVLFSHWTNPLLAASPAPFENKAASQIAQVAQNAQTTVIQSVDLDFNTGQLLIRTNQTAAMNSGWDRSTGAYRITIAAQPLGALPLPATGATSLLLRIEVRPDSDGTTSLLLYPAAGVQIGQLRMLNSQVVALPLARGGTVLMPPGPNDTGSVPPLNPDFTTIPTRPPVVPPNPRPVPLPPRPRVPIGTPLVVLDPGHGGPDPGAVGIGGIQEKEIVLDVSHQVKQLLQSQGVQVVMTREDDRDLDLEPRTSLANSVRATVFVSIHANAVSLSRPEINGVETFHYLDSSQPLAASIQQSMLDATGMNSRGVKRARFYVLRYTNMPSALVEIGFVTGAQDAPRLADPSFRSTVAQAIARGILRYLGR